MWPEMSYIRGIFFVNLIIQIWIKMYGLVWIYMAWILNGGQPCQIHEATYHNLTHVWKLNKEVFGDYHDRVALLFF